MRGTIDERSERCGEVHPRRTTNDRDKASAKNGQYEGTSGAGSAATRSLCSCRNDQMTETDLSTCTAPEQAPMRRLFAAKRRSMQSL
jgi:hypothetical protein